MVADGLVAPRCVQMVVAELQAARVGILCVRVLSVMVALEATEGAAVGQLFTSKTMALAVLRGRQTEEAGVLGVLELMPVSAETLTVVAFFRGATVARLRTLLLTPQVRLLLMAVALAGNPAGFQTAQIVTASAVPPLEPQPPTQGMGTIPVSLLSAFPINSRPPSRRARLPL